MSDDEKGEESKAGAGEETQPRPGVLHEAREAGAVGRVSEADVERFNETRERIKKRLAMGAAGRDHSLLRDIMDGVAADLVAPKNAETRHELIYAVATNLDQVIPRSFDRKDKRYGNVEHVEYTYYAPGYAPNLEAQGELWPLAYARVELYENTDDHYAISMRCEARVQQRGHDTGHELYGFNYDVVGLKVSGTDHKAASSFGVWWAAVQNAIKEERKRRQLEQVRHAAGVRNVSNVDRLMALYDCKDESALLLKLAAEEIKRADLGRLLQMAQERMCGPHAGIDLANSPSFTTKQVFTSASGSIFPNSVVHSLVEIQELPASPLAFYTPESPLDVEEGGEEDNGVNEARGSGGLAVQDEGDGVADHKPRPPDEE